MSLMDFGIRGNEYALQIRMRVKVAIILAGMEGAILLGTKNNGAA